MNEFKRLFFDIETSPNLGLFWRPGNKVSISHINIIVERQIICICWKWEGSKKVYSLEWEGIDKSDKKMLDPFTKVVEGADEIIGHNSDNFDVKWLRGRCLFHGIPMSHDLNLIDTLKLSRRAFNLNSHKLAYIGDFIGIGSKGDPGGLKTWKELMFKDHDDPVYQKAMRRMVRYCKKDVVILEKIFDKFKPYIKHKTHRAVHNGGDRIDCPECESEDTHSRGYETRASGHRVAKMKCNSCGKGWSLPES